MTYFDDNEDRIIHGRHRPGSRSPRSRAREKEELRKAMHSAPGQLGRAAREALKAPPGSDLARARIAAHNTFDPLWQSGHFTRGVAYEWLAGELGIPVIACHMVLFDAAQCERVVAICEAHPAARRAKVALVADEFEDLTGG